MFAAWMAPPAAPSPPVPALPADLITGILPAHEVSIFAGASGSGKTTLIMQMVAQLQQQPGPAGDVSVFGHQAQPHLRIGYIAADRAWKAHTNAAERAGVNLDLLKVRSLVDDPAIDETLLESAPLKLLTSLITVLMPLDLLIIDPMVSLLGCDTNKYHLNAARLLRLNRLAMANHLAILGTHHAGKARTDFGFRRPQDRISGTSALQGFTSTQLFLSTPAENGTPFSEWTIVSHTAPPVTFWLTFDDQSKLFTVVPPELAEQPAGPTLHAAMQATLDLLPPTGDVVTLDALKIGTADVCSHRTLERALAQLLANGAISKGSKNTYRRSIQ